MAKHDLDSASPQSAPAATLHGNGAGRLGRRVSRAVAAALVAGVGLTTVNAAVAGANAPINGETVYMFVANEAGSVTLYRLPFAGDAAPLETIAGSKTGLSAPDGVAVNSARDLFVTNVEKNSVLEFAPGANGNVSPIAALDGPNTQLGSPVGVAVDSSGDLWVFNMGGTITEYPPGSSGNVAPVHAINVWGPQYPCQQVSNDPQTIAVDPSGNLWVDCGSMVLEYGPGATDGADPEAVVTGPMTGLETGASYCCGYAGGLALDGSGDIFVANEYNETTEAAPSITEYPPGSDGDIAPVSTISGPATEVPHWPAGLGWDDDNLYLATEGAQAVYEYPAGAPGDIAPTAELSGAATGLEDPGALAFVTIRSGEYCPGGCEA
jgi:hypothetical protein